MKTSLVNGPYPLARLKSVTHSTPVMTSRLLNSTNPCIMVFLVSGPNMTPPPLIPAAPPAFAVGFREEVEAAGADDNKSPERIVGRPEVRVGYKCAT